MSLQASSGGSAQEPAGDLQHPDVASRGEPVGAGDLDFGAIGGPEPDYEPVQMTDRELAIARGDDPDLSADDDLGVEPAAQPAARQAAPAAPSSPDWADQGIMFTADRMGIDRETVQELGSAKAFWAMAKQVDSQMRRFAEATVARGADGRFVSKEQAAGQSTEEPTPTAAEVKPLNDDGTLNADFFLKAGERGEEYSDDTLALVRAIAQSQQQIRDFQVQQQRQREEAETVNFHYALDQLDSEFFGRSLDDRGQWADIPEESIQRRQRMMAACSQLMEWEQAQAAGEGREFTPPNWEDVKTKAFVLAFGKMPGQQSPPQQQAAAASQLPANPAASFDPLTASPTERERAIASSMRRRGAGSNGAGPGVRPPVNPADMDEFEAMANHPNVVATWNRLQNANGNH